MQMLGKWSPYSLEVFDDIFSPPGDKANIGIRPGLPVTANWSNKAITQTASKNFSLIYKLSSPFCFRFCYSKFKEIFSRNFYWRAISAKQNKIPPRLEASTVCTINVQKKMISITEECFMPSMLWFPISKQANVWLVPGSEELELQDTQQATRSEHSQIISAPFNYLFIHLINTYYWWCTW